MKIKKKIKKNKEKLLITHAILEILTSDQNIMEAKLHLTAECHFKHFKDKFLNINYESKFKPVSQTSTALHFKYKSIKYSIPVPEKNIKTANTCTVSTQNVVLCFSNFNSIMN